MAEEETVLEEVTPDTVSIWDRYTPIVETDNGTFMYLTGDIQEPSFYNEFVHNLYTATEEQVFNVIVSNGGGDLSSAVMIVDAIRNTPATVRVHVTGFAASAATIISLACDELTIAPHTPFMIHNYSTGGGGHVKGHELKARQAFMDTNTNLAFQDFYNGFLTEEEMSSVIDGTDMWMGPEEVYTRWEKRKQFLEEQNG